MAQSDGQLLIDRMVAWLRGFVVMSEGQALAVALWALNTWVYERFRAVPYLEISAATKGCGKTTLLELLNMVVRCPKYYATLRVLAMVRAIEQEDGKCTFLLDESERLNRAELGDTRSLLTVGYRAGQVHPVTMGGKVAEFRAYAPRAFALIGNLVDVLRDRSIPIDLERQMPERNLQLEADRAEAEAQGIIEAWKAIAAKIAGDSFTAVNPEWLTRPRERELWTPLYSLALALKLDKRTIDLLTRTSVDLGMAKLLPPKVFHSAQSEQDADDRGMADAVLKDLRSVIQDGERVIFSAVAVERLKALPTGPWRVYRREGLTPITLAALLARFGVEPKTVSVGVGRTGRKQAQGYAVPDLRRVSV